MPKHEISLTIPQKITVVNKDMSVLVKVDGSPLGRVSVSKGSIDWVPSPKQSGHRLSWTKFAALIEEHGKPIKK